MGRETLGPLKVLCPSIGECQCQEAGVGGLVSKGRGEAIVEFWRRSPWSCEGSMPQYRGMPGPGMGVGGLEAGGGGRGEGFLEGELGKGIALKV